MKIAGTIFLLLLTILSYGQETTKDKRPCSLSNSSSTKTITGIEDSSGGGASLWGVKWEQGIYLVGRSTRLKTDTTKLKLGPCTKPIGDYYTIAFTDGETYHYSISNLQYPIGMISILLSGVQPKQPSKKKLKARNITAYGDIALAGKLTTKLIKNITYWEPSYYVEDEKITSKTYKATTSYSISIQEAEKLREQMACLLNH